MVAKIITDTLNANAAKLFSDANGNISPDHGQTSSLQQQPQTEDRFKSNILNGTKESGYAVKMILNLLSNLITNQAFETAFTNHLQVKKDEKLLTNIQNSLKLHEDYRPSELNEDSLNTGSSFNLATVTHLIEAIKSINDTSAKDGYTSVLSMLQHHLKSSQR
ncbi:hypothetical protein SUGI_1512340 [Cryptomeria japonica]|uniref:Uncharacterized protein n=1 Tax=Cryptomeria japonica TaxID=3369 RepID=A0AAD3NU39_CRYJA|nr:hypothetical protein SUGI_1512340 [Cryptomeria japonica]